MTTNYKILGQELNRLVYTCPENTNTIISKLKIKNTSYPANIDINIGPSASYSFSNVYTTIFDQDFIDANSTGNGNVSSYATQSDGKILLGGTFITANGTLKNRIARFNSDGTIDDEFNPNVNSNVATIAIQSDGKILIGGIFTTVGGVTRNRIARLNSDGTLDTGFNPNVNSDVATIAIQSDNKIIIGGNFTTVGGVTSNFLARLNSDGSLDTTFTSNMPVFNGSMTKVYVQLNQKIIVAGGFEVSSKVRTAMLNSNGTLDSSYTFNTPLAFTYAIQELPDGRILMGGNYGYGQINGNATTGNLFLTDSSGTIDNTFTITENEPIYTIRYVPNLGILYVSNAVYKINLDLTENIILQTNTLQSVILYADNINGDYFYITQDKMYKTKQDLVSSTIISGSNYTYLVKNKEIGFDETIEFNGGIALEEGQVLLIDTPNGEDVIIQAYGIEETI
jgi:uncharacterized delta-60 repeat protein